jgi:hypothetical protein
MLDVDAAIQIADDHIAAQPAPLNGYRMLHLGPQEFDKGWYFDYGIECDLNISESHRESFAGAPGFIVERSNGDLRVVSWDERRSLGLEHR